MTCISELLNLPIPREALGTDSSREASTQATTPYNVLAHSEVYPTAKRPQKKPASWTPEEDATVLKMKKDGYSWEEIHAALPNRTKGIDSGTLLYETQIVVSVGVAAPT